MIFIEWEKTTDTTRARIIREHYRPDLLPEEVLNMGIVVDKLPSIMPEQGKEAILYINPTTRDLWYEMVDIPPTEEEELKALKAEVALLWYELMMGGTA